MDKITLSPRLTLQSKRPVAATRSHQVPLSALQNTLRFGQSALSSALWQKYTGIRFGSTDDIADALLNDVKQVGKKQFKSSKQVMTFKEFLREAAKEPAKYLRNSSQHTLDAIDFYNKQAGVDGKKVNVLGKEVEPFAAMSRPWDADLTNKNAIYGLDLTLHEIQEVLRDNERKTHPDRAIVIHGPTGTAKTNTVVTLFEMDENYSKEDEGALYTFNWVLPDNSDELDGGLEPATLVSEAEANQNFEEPTDLFNNGMVVPVKTRTNPIFLLDKKSRNRFFQKLRENGKLPKSFNKDYFLVHGLDSASQVIYDALWRHYKGDIDKVLNHVQVVRWTSSLQNRRGLARIPTAETPDAALVDITPETDWNRLSRPIKEAFMTAGLHELVGPFIQANRGHILFDDQFKLDRIAHFLTLVQPAEKGIVTISSRMGTKAVEERTDLTIWTTTNDDDLELLKEKYPNWKTMSEKLIFIPAGYARRYGTAAELYESKLREVIPVNSGRHISPHAIDTFALWVTLTTLFPPNRRSKIYDTKIDAETSEVLKQALEKLKDKGLLYKALLYQGEDLNAFELDPAKQPFSTQEQEILKQHVDKIANEYKFGPEHDQYPFFYEGRLGFPTRIAISLFQEMADKKPNECFSAVDVLERLDERAHEPFEYIKEFEQFKNLVGDPANPQNLLAQVKHHMARKIRYQFQNALGLIKPEEEHVKVLTKYLKHVVAANQHSDVERGWEVGNSRSPSNEFMEELEKLFQPDIYKDTQRKSFRDNFLQKFVAWKNRNPGKNPLENIASIYGNYINNLKSKDLADGQEKLKEAIVDIQYYYTHKDEPEEAQVTAQNRKRMSRLHKALENLKSPEMGYCDECIPKLVMFAFEPGQHGNSWKR